MSYDAPVAPSLFDLLARDWTLPGAVEALCFNRDGSAVAFAHAGGLAIAPLADPERPQTRIRVAADTGRMTIQPRQAPPRPLATVAGVSGPLAPYGEKSFVTGAAKGGLVSVTPRGQAVPLAATLAGPLAGIARDPASGAVAVASGSQVMLLPDDREAAPLRHEHGGPVSALAFAPSGGALAVGLDGAVSFWEAGREAARAALPAAPTRLSWSPDGQFLACGFGTPGFALIRRSEAVAEVNADYPTPVASFGWSAPAAAFLTSGAFRTIGWTLTAEGLGDPLEAGRTGLLVVERIAVSPDRPLVAAGYSNGLLCVNRIGGRDEMLLRNDGGAVTALAWSPDGAHLALGDTAGAAAIVTFPTHLFK